MSSLRLLAASLPAMTEDERRRYLDGRNDWREDCWQDHCGRPYCDHCSGYAEGDARKAAIRREVLS